MERALVFTLILLLCGTAASAVGGLHILPAPKYVEPGSGSYTLPQKIQIQVSADGFSLMRKMTESTLDNRLAQRISIKRQTGSGRWLRIGDAPMPPAPKGDEAYSLHISPAGIALSADADAGFRHGVRTLMQILAQGDAIPACKIEDSPALAHRGLMIDMARYKEKDETYFRLIEEMAAWKMNALYLHFTDNEGCAIELKSHPELVTRHAMSQETVKKLIARGSELGVRVIPEVELWGHAYWITIPHPELAEKGSDSLCLSNEKLYPLIDDVIKEVAALFPDPYLHIGCDEATVGTCDACKAKVEADKVERVVADHVNRVNGIVRKYGKTSVAWGDLRDWPKGVAELLDRNIVMEPWYYNPVVPPTNLRKLRQLGFQTLGAPALVCRGNKVCPGSDNLENVRNWSVLLKQEKAEGVVSTVWVPQRSVPTTLGPGIAWAADHAWNPGSRDLGEVMEAYLVNRFGLQPTAERVDRMILLGETDDSLKTAFWRDAKALKAIGNKEDKRPLERLRGLAEGFRKDLAQVSINRREFEALAIAADVSEHLALRRDVGRQVLNHIEQAGSDVKAGHADRATSELKAAASAVRDMEKERMRLFDLLQKSWDHDRYPNDPERSGGTGVMTSHIIVYAQQEYWKVNTLYWWFGQPESYGFAEGLVVRLEDAAQNPGPESVDLLP